MSDIIQGRNPLLEALKSGRSVNKILLARNIGRHSSIAEIIHLSRDKRIPVEFVDRRVIDEACESFNHQGVIAYASVKEYVSLDDLFDESRKRDEEPLYCILDGIEDPHNLGAILRTADASGVHGVIVRSRRAVGLTSIVEKTSAGAVEYIPVARVSNISQAIQILKQHNIWIIGVDASGKAKYTQIDYKLPTAIVIGSEGKGVSDLVRKNCDSLVSIPMRGNINSLNASVAAALVTYEAFRQRSW
jgi:23S rRNA (guanosine2251-2'-O)-methyltransferase